MQTFPVSEISFDDNFSQREKKKNNDAVFHFKRSICRKALQLPTARSRKASSMTSRCVGTTQYSGVYGGGVVPTREELQEGSQRRAAEPQGLHRATANAA